MRGFVWLGLAVLGLAGAAAAQTDPAQPPAKPAKQKKVCRREEVTGSLLGKTECHTQAEWDEMARTQREATQRTLTQQGQPPR